MVPCPLNTTRKCSSRKNVSIFLCICSPDSCFCCLFQNVCGSYCFLSGTAIYSVGLLVVAKPQCRTVGSHRETTQFTHQLLHQVVIGVSFCENLTCVFDFAFRFRLIRHTSMVLCAISTTSSRKNLNVYVQRTYKRPYVLSSIVIFGPSATFVQLHCVPGGVLTCQKHMISNISLLRVMVPPTTKRDILIILIVCRLTQPVSIRTRHIGLTCDSIVFRAASTS